jgi:hypothetical protein
MDSDDRAALGSYCAMLAERLGGELVMIMALGDGLHLLVVTARELSPEEQEALATEAGALVPHFLPESSLVEPRTDRVQRLLDRVRTEGVDVWPGPVSM